MMTFRKLSALALLWLGVLAALGGCSGWRDCSRWLYRTPSATPLGSQSDAMWQRQEANAEASDFVVYQHEFKMNDTRLNTGGEDHLKAIAVRLRTGADLPVIVERSMTGVRPDSEFKYPVHPDCELDMRRRDIVARSLAALGVCDAEQRVLVAPALAPGINASEAAQAYNQSFNQTGGFGGGAGGFGGSWFGGGGVGGGIF